MLYHPFVQSQLLPQLYFDGGNDVSSILDAFIVASSVAELALANAKFGLGSMRVIRLFRLLRVVKAGDKARQFPAFQSVIMLISVSAERVWPMLFLLVLLVFMFSALGMQLCMDIPGPSDDDNSPPHPFQDFGASAMTVFQTLTLEDWGVPYSFTQENASELGGLYFVSIVVLGQMLLLNLILAAIIDGSITETQNH